MEAGDDLTVLEESKVERLKKKEEIKTKSVFHPVVKCIVAGFLCLVVLGCTVFSKIFVIVVAEQLNHVTGEKPTINKTRNAALFIMLMLILMIPQALSFLRAAWASARLKNCPWPTKRACVMGVIGSILEVAGLCIFVLITLSKTVHIKGSESIAVMNCVSVFPIVWQLIKKRRRTDNTPRKTKSLILFAFCVILQTAAIIVIILLPSFQMYNLSLLSLFLVSIAWTAKMRKLQITPRLQPDEQPIAEEDFDKNSVHPGEALHRKTARTKATVISEGIKLVLTPFAGFLVAYLTGLFKPGDLHDGFVTFAHDDFFKYFLVNIFLSFAGHFFGVLACSMATQKIAFALPLTLATPISFTLLSIPQVCQKFDVECDRDLRLDIVIPVMLCVWLSQWLSTIYYVWTSQDFIMAKEEHLFWVPSYNGVLLEQNLLLNRKNQLTEDFIVNHNKVAKDSCVFICTTMYHEADYEMEQLLYSLHRVDEARSVSKRRIESHIWFDGAVKRDVLNSYVLQLISLVSKTMRVNINACMKLETPYGMELRWRLPGGMNFHIHLKDNIKVKNKKRWSQVMYMSYVLDFRIKQINVREEDTYILTTDADINFNADSVEALLDLMMRDARVGAVCGRTHPLGNGPLVWYQIFDYAIGHWFQKVANHVLGSVLCCPGCFSVYRAKALRDVLPLYATTADHAVDFLTKDMGEDRWLCTLMVQAGWRLEYCAAAENYTYCPDNFDEFYKQRRRWVPSTLANLGLLISEWKTTVTNSDCVSFPFILYQFTNVFSTLIGPATVILIIVGGLQYGWKTEPLLSLILLLIICFGYGFICLFTSQNFQLKTAKMLTLVFALLMGVVVVGLAEQMVEKPYGDKTPITPTPTSRPPTKKPTKAPTKALYESRFNYSNFPNPDIRNPFERETGAYFVNNVGKSNSSDSSGSTDFLLGFAVSSWYFFGLVGIFMITAMCHPTEAYCLLHGVWYLLCLPSGYLFLMIYSICNLTDRSWGTREGKSTADNSEPFLRMISDKIIWLCRGCKDPEPPEPEAQPINVVVENNASDTSESEQSPEELPQDDVAVDVDNDQPTTSHEDPAPRRATVRGGILKSALKKPSSAPTSPGQGADKSKQFRFPGEKAVRFPSKLPKAKAQMPVLEWLPKGMKVYAPIFEENGYDDTSFIAFMTEKDLEFIGIEKRGHRRNILNEIEQLPNWELDNNVPNRVESWLEDLGLYQYWVNFRGNGYTTPRDLEGLKTMNTRDLKTALEGDLGVNKRGHYQKLVKAIKKLQYPSAIERKIREARAEMDKIQLRRLQDDNEGAEFTFWTKLREARLLPESKAFGQHSELSDQLAELRDSALLALTLSNLLWIILIFSLTTKADLKAS